MPQKTEISPPIVGFLSFVEAEGKNEELLECGFRQLPIDELKKLFEDLPSPSEIETREKLKEIVEEVGRRTGRRLMEKEPTVPPQKGREKPTFLGPYYRGDPLEYVSDKQRELKKDLERELEKLKRREYPGYA